MNPLTTRPPFALQPGVNREAAFCATAHGTITEPSRDAVPIGSVEWTREYAARFGVPLPEPDTYPEAMRPWLLRAVRRGVYADAAPGEFVKPIRCKAFTGSMRCEATETVDPSEPVWISDPVEFVAEWRCYILRGAVAGWAQYGDGDDAEPDLDAVRDMLAAWRGPEGWALDVGRLADGRMALVEVNDGWALGYYKGCDRRAYLNVIAARWTELAAMHALATRPPDGKYPECSADVILVYADGREVPGYWSDWIGWLRTDGWVPCECDYDDVMPIGWKPLDTQA